MSSPSSQPNRLTLTDKEKQHLLTIARRSLSWFVEHRAMAEIDTLDVPVTETMNTIAATFVTLHKDAMLRGCIGEIFPSQPLYQSVLTNAIRAGVSDPRFPAVTASELSQLHMEISVLTPPQDVPSYQDIQLGRDGMILSQGRRHAVFLPQVAPEQGWDLDQTLTHLSMKAGLPAEAWKQPETTFQTFQAIVFQESRD